MYRGPFSRIYGITGDIIILEASLGELGTDIPRILGIACRGGEGGVKGLDREAAAKPPLTPPAPRLCSIYPGNVSGTCPVQYRSETNFVFIKLKNGFADPVLICTSCASVHLCAPFVPFCSDACLREMKNHRYLWGRHRFEFDSLWFQERANNGRFPSSSRIF
jgi:hypothetical protein